MIEEALHEGGKNEAEDDFSGFYGQVFKGTALRVEDNRAGRFFLGIRVLDQDAEVARLRSYGRWQAAERGIQRVTESAKVDIF